MHLRFPHIQDTVDLFVLSTFAVAQPLFGLVTQNPGFLAARRSEPAEIGWVVAGLTFGLPLLLVLIENVAGFLGSKVRKVVHGFLAALLISLILLPVSRRVAVVPGWAWCLISLLVGTFAACLYLKYRTRRWSLLFLSPSVFLFPLLFLNQEPIRKQVFGAGKAGPLLSIPIGQPVSIVMVIFDEFPLSSLMDEREEIDSKHFPHFATFSRDAIWFRNASAVTDGTLNSVPSILCGLYPEPALRLMPNARDYPLNLFTLLATTYKFHVQENNTRLCPQSLCQEEQKYPTFQRMRGWVQDLGVLYLYVVLPRKMTNWLPDISTSWGNFVAPGNTMDNNAQGIEEYGELNKWTDRPGEFTGFVHSIAPSAKPTLHFLHILLPHAPWEFLPSGKKYTLEPTRLRGLLEDNDTRWDKWGSDHLAVAEAYQRHMLQVGLVDRLFGTLITRLRSTGLYDQSLIVVVADHGCSFRFNDFRRKVTQSNFPDILNVPFFVKLPFQKGGRIDDANVETIDAVPTIADVLKAKLPWKVDGFSALDPASHRRSKRTFVSEQGESLSFPSDLHGRVEAIRQRLALLSQESERGDFFERGPYHELLGVAAEKVGPIEDSTGSLELDHQGYLSSHDSQAPVVLTHLTGRIHRPQNDRTQPLYLALAINGTIRAVTETYWSGSVERFSAVTPDWAYREGHNDVNGYAVLGTNGGVRLAKFRMLNDKPQYKWGDLIRLDRSGNGSNYLGDGWSRRSEGDFTWTDGKRASLAVDHSPPSGTVLLRSKVMPYWVKNKVEHQRIRILVDHRFAGEWGIDRPGIQEKSLVIPGEFFSHSARTMITLEIPDAVSPASLGIGPDVRELGLAVFWVSLVTQEQSGRLTLITPISVASNTTLYPCSG